VLPASVRKTLGLRTGDVLSVRVETDRLILERRDAVLARLRTLVSKVPSTVSLADELIAERREEVRRERSKR
jgi:bifunctional DNA-binding transcriptional regulator/antitoxin component of YhaV-PrlF toxin-antitoxin module